MIARSAKSVCRLDRLVLAGVLIAGIGSAGAEPARNWQEIRPEGGGFVALVPGNPVTSEGATRSPELHLLAITTFFDLPATGGRSFQISYSDLQPELRRRFRSADAVIGNARDLAVARAHGRIRRDVAASLAGNPGRSVVFDVHADDTGRDLSVAIRYYLVESRLYQLTAVGPRGFETDAEARRFFGSFRLVPVAVADDKAKPGSRTK